MDFMSLMQLECKATVFPWNGYIDARQLYKHEKRVKYLYPGGFIFDLELHI